jgi:hypothetical protein
VGAKTEPKTKDTPLPRVHPLVVALVVFHIVAITIYALPKPSDRVLNNEIAPRGSDALLRFNQLELKNWAPIYGYLYPLGLWQYWDMFAPDPVQKDAWCDAEVVYLDGTKATFEYPRMKSLSIFEKFMKERHRKYYERVDGEANRYLWPPFAQYIGYQMAIDPKNPPVQVNLTRHFQFVVRHDDPKAVEQPYTAYTYYRYIVDQKKLYADKEWKFGLH